MLHIKLAVPVSNLDYTAFLVQSVVMNSNLMGDKFLCNFGMKFQHQFITVAHKGHKNPAIYLGKFE